MTQTVLGRLTLTHLLVALASVLLAAALSSYLFSTRYMAQRRSELVAAAQSIASSCEKPLWLKDDPRQGRLYENQLYLTTTTAGQMLGGHVCVFDAKHARLIAASHPGEPGQEQAAASSYLHANLNATHAETMQVSCQGLVFSITVPVFHQPGGILVGLVVVRCPVSGLQRIVAAQRLSALLAVLGAGLMALLLALMASRSFSDPLREISRAAEGLAEGDFEVHVAPRGPAEIAMLARTVNWSAQNLRTLEHMRRDFIANASHQLRTPLTSIRGYLEALSDGTAESPEQRAHCLAVVLEQVALLQGLVSELLELSRWQAGAVEMQRERVSLRQVAERASQHLTPQATQRGVTLIVDPDSSSAEVLADPDRLLQAAHNLLDNAIRHTPAGQPVRLSVAEMEDRIELTVADRGPGLGPLQTDDLWERFHSGRTNAGSAGLGLAIVKEIVLAHDGEVFARPNPEGGALFGFSLPRS